MSETAQYPKRLIEVDLPIKRISAHARREKSIRHGHISTLHIWWARRPLAACRAVICAALWPDPADDLCPESFRDVAAREMRAWATTHISLLGEESYKRFNKYAKNPRKLDDPVVLRQALLDFIADFANWDSSIVPQFLATSRALTQSAHEGLGGMPGTRPLVVDPFAGGGSIPLEALRVGADAFASDLNPLPVLLNKVMLEYLPKYGQRLVDEVRKSGEWIRHKAEEELSQFYPLDPDGSTPIAYLWARTIRCEGPSCGAEVPLIRSLWLAKKADRLVALRLLPRPTAKRVDFDIIVRERTGWVRQDDTQETIENPKFDGTARRGAATCPCCGYTTPVARVREQLKEKRGGANDARLFCVVTLPRDSDQRGYRKATRRDLEAFANARRRLAEVSQERNTPGFAVVPDEVIPLTEIRRISVPIYGMSHWGDLFSDRQALAITTLVSLSGELARKVEAEDPAFARAVTTIIGLAISRFTDICNALCMWETSKTQVRHMFTRQAIGMLWDYAEPNILADAAGNFGVTLGTMTEVLEREAIGLVPGHIEQASATRQALPEDSAQAVITDPPYYDAVPYAHLSDFFYVWLRRALCSVHPDLFREAEVPKASEIVVDRPHELSRSTKDIAFYESELTKAFLESRRILRPDGIATIVFASKTTASWEAILSAVVEAGWIITGSWPIDTEMENRVAAQGQARLASSVHLVCRPREKSGGSLSTDEIGDWRDVLAQLPRRIHEWMPRLAAEGVVGADAIFACLGPALEIFPRYSRVERASGEAVTLREHLEQVWAAVSHEALSMIFADPDTSGLDEGARLTAMWLWTIASPSDASAAEGSNEDAIEEVEDDGKAIGSIPSGYVLEFDAARKIAQGLGARLEELAHVVEVKGDKARLLSVAQRTKYLFAGADAAPQAKKSSKRKPQRALFEELEEVAEQQGWGDVGTPKPGSTALDRVHQSMILFGAGRGEALRRFLVDEGVGRSAQFWKLAQALSALYPTGTDEKRWVDGVLARKKGLGF